MTRARDLAAFVSNADGDIKFDTDTLFIDSSANSVGIGTSTPTAYGNGQSTLVVEDSGNPAIALSDTGQARDWFLVALGDGLGVRYADGGGSGSASNLTESAFFKNNGKFAIGHSSPATHLDVDGGANSDHATFSGTAGRGLKISTASGGAADEVVDFDAQASGTTQALTFSTGGTERARINQNGLTFNGDTAAANALDDYEEGTFTPTSGVTLGADTVGIYRKVGKLVHVGMKFTMGSSSSGSQAVISSLPFANVSSNAARAGLVVSWNSSGVGAGLTFLVGQGSTNGNFYIDGQTKTYSQMANKTVYIGGTYPTAS